MNKTNIENVLRAQQTLTFLIPYIGTLYKIKLLMEKDETKILKKTFS